MPVLMGIRLDEMLHLRFKVLCVQKKLSMTEVVQELIEAWVAEQEGGQSAGQEKKEGEHDTT